MATDDHGGFSLEGWTLAASGPRRRFAVPVPEPTRTVGLPVEDGRTVLVDYQPTASMLTVLDGDGRRDRAPIRVEECKFVPAPAGSADAVGLRRAGPGSRVLLVRHDGVTELAAVPAPLVHGWPFGADRMLLTAADSSAYLLDLRSGRAERLSDEVMPAGTALLAVGAERFVLAERQPGSDRLLLGSLTGPPCALPLPAGAGRATPIAVRPDGTQLALLVERGAASRLLLLDEDGGQPIGPAAASLLPAAAWTTDGLWGIGSSPDRPAGYYWLAPDGGPLRWSAPAEPGPAARLENFPGADGRDLEAVVYGPDWRSAERVVLALHGGPRDHWRMAFDPALRMLAGAGVCVIAVNQRGSTGYGIEFELAIKGCWGGPDLADIRAVATRLRAERPAGSCAPGLWGASYGAFLALLAAAAEPDGWACCVAVSPFVSAPALYP
ncbi:MAG TPA: prolyl oligopeptidase family serine peptidase, partial [Jatrophihabitans sp.]|nr:prolyl oligopeptidase family serine peptidase [Jatrophihabitans sp.]